MNILLALIIPASFIFGVALLVWLIQKIDDYFVRKGYQKNLAGGWAMMFVFYLFLVLIVYQEMARR